MSDLERTVLEEIEPFLNEELGNPSSLHRPGRKAKEAIDRARGFIAQLLGFKTNEVFFAPSIEYANNVAILGRARSVEANSVRRSFCAAGRDGRDIKSCLAQLAQRNWETQFFDLHEADWRQRLSNAKAERACTHLDATLFAREERGALQLFMAEFDSVAVDGSALYEPLTIAALAVRRGVNLMPLVFGGGQESGLFPGTESVSSIVALGAAANFRLKLLG